MNWIPVEEDGLPPVGEWLVYSDEPMFKMNIHSCSVGMSGNNHKIAVIAGTFSFDAPTITYYCKMIEGPKV